MRLVFGVLVIALAAGCSSKGAPTDPAAPGGPTGQAVGPVTLNEDFSARQVFP